MKVIATGYQQQRLIIDEVDAITASMTAQVLNDIEKFKFYEHAQAQRPSWHYHAEADTFEVKS